MNLTAPLVPFAIEWHRVHGLCRCGCGGRTNTAAQALTSGGRRLAKGEHYDFVSGHHRVRNVGPRHIVDENGCWVWQRFINHDGYGVSSAQRYGERLAHRIAFREANGWVEVGILDHLCRNRACVNPAHLEPVTPAENSRRGSTPKLSWESVRAIRASTERGVDLAARYGVTPAAITAVRKNKNWRED